MFHGGALQKLFLATIKVCCVRQLEKTKIARRNNKNLLFALGFRLSFSIGDQDIEMITNTRYLGVQIDSKLNWYKHIDTIKTKANRALGLIKYCKYRVRNKRDTK